MNLYSVKKMGIYFMMSIIPAIVFVTMIMTGAGIAFSLVLIFVMAFLMIILANLMLKHPLTSLIEGKGMLTMTLDSTGFIETFLVSAEQPFIRGKLGKNKEVETMFDRDIAQYLVPPQEGRLVNATMIGNDGLIKGERQVLLMPTPTEKADYLFSFGTYPTFIYNKVLDTFLQKKLLSNFEQTTFTKHAVMYLLKKTEELSSSVRDFSRYIVEQIRPKKSWMERNRWLIWIVIGVGIVMFALLFIPAILENMGNVSLPGLGGGVLGP